MRKNGVVLAKDEVIEQIRIARDEPAVQNIDDFKQLLHEEYNIDVLEARAKKTVKTYATVMNTLIKKV
ncbi:hypothetical protein J4714_11765 [Staphylococcus epidermidis]|nr:hypothetical protein [Staphylococcus epidermidis]